MKVWKSTLDDWKCIMHKCFIVYCVVSFTCFLFFSLFLNNKYLAWACVCVHSVKLSTFFFTSSTLDHMIILCRFLFPLKYFLLFLAFLQKKDVCFFLFEHGNNSNPSVTYVKIEIGYRLKKIKIKYAIAINTCISCSLIYTPRFFFICSTHCSVCIWVRLYACFFPSSRRKRCENENILKLKYIIICEYGTWMFGSVCQCVLVCCKYYLKQCEKKKEEEMRTICETTAKERYL